MRKYAFLLCLCLSWAEPEPNYDYKVNEIDLIMELMDEPSWALGRMIKNKHTVKKDWKAQVAIIAEESDKLVALNHPDKLFADEAKKVAKEVHDFLKNIDSYDEQKLYSTWKEIKKSCQTCHDVYEWRLKLAVSKP